MRCTSKKGFPCGALGAVVGAILLLASAAWYLPARLDAQSPAAATEVPDLSETWARLGPLPGRPDVPLVPTARALGFGLAFDEVLSPRYDCSPVSAPLILLDPFNFRIEQQPDRVFMHYEKDDVVRTVWLEGHGHPRPGAYDFTIQGHSIGWYENNQLVVVTSKFVFDPTGLDEPRHIPSSTLKKVTERYWREGDRLKVEVTTEDPLILLKPFAFTWEWERTELPLERYNCDPEDARYPAKFYGSKYQDPNWVRLPATGGQEQ
jgi:hypothetical protein